jgi:thiol-disulfide isomerase/thioredoxin
MKNFLALLPTYNKTTGFLIAALVILALLAIYFGTSQISGFADGSGEKTFYMVYADWCPHCQTVKPSMQKFKEDVSSGAVAELKGKSVNVELIDGESKNPELDKLPPVKGYPTFFLKNGSDVQEYKGPREVPDMIKFIMGN